jgi:hypothetical protein
MPERSTAMRGRAALKNSTRAVAVPRPPASLRSTWAPSAARSSIVPLKSRSPWPRSKSASASSPAVVAAIDRVPIGVRLSS